MDDDTDGCLPVFYRQQQSPDALESSQLEEEVDELSLIDHSEIMARLTLKQEVGSFGVLFMFFGLYSTESWFSEGMVSMFPKQDIALLMEKPM